MESNQIPIIKLEIATDSDSDMFVDQALRHILTRDEDAEIFPEAVVFIQEDEKYCLLHLPLFIFEEKEEWPKIIDDVMRDFGGFGYALHARDWDKTFLGSDGENSEVEIAFLSPGFQKRLYRTVDEEDFGPIQSSTKTLEENNPFFGLGGISNVN